MAAGSLDVSGRRAVLGAFLIVLLAGSVLFGYTVTGHVAVLQASDIETQVTDVSVVSADRIEVTVEVRNPTIRSITVYGAELEAVEDTRTVARDTPGETPRVAVGAGEQESVTVSMTVQPAYLEAVGEEGLRSAVDADRVTVRGILSAKIESRPLDLEV